jgi:hypothetical protein
MNIWTNHKGRLSRVGSLLGATWVAVACSGKGPAAPTEAPSPKLETEARTECDTSANVQQCCSARKCGGQVLNNRDMHNCFNSGGKSWHPAASGGNLASCFAL